VRQWNRPESIRPHPRSDGRPLNGAAGSMAGKKRVLDVPLYVRGMLFSELPSDIQSEFLSYELTVRPCLKNGSKLHLYVRLSF